MPSSAIAPAARNVLIAVACLFLNGCGSTAPAPGKEAAAEKKSAPRQAPDVFRVNFDTTKGPVVVEVHREWAPRGADQFYTLVSSGFFDGARFFRVKPKFVVQFGIAADPAKNRIWQNAPLQDDPVKESNRKGTVTYAKTSMPNSRTTQVFINLADNSKLDKDGFAPFGKVVSGMEAVEKFYSYGDMAPMGQGPDPTEIQRRGNEYLDARFPRLDAIRKATVE